MPDTGCREPDCAQRLPRDQLCPETSMAQRPAMLRIALPDQAAEPSSTLPRAGRGPRMGCTWTLKTHCAQLPAGAGAQLCPGTGWGAETRLPGNGVVCPAHRPPSGVAASGVRASGSSSSSGTGRGEAASASLFWSLVNREGERELRVIEHLLCVRTCLVLPSHCGISSLGQPQEAVDIIPIYSWKN